MLQLLAIATLLLTSYNTEGKKKVSFLAVRGIKNIKYVNNVEISINSDNRSVNILLDIRADLTDVLCNTNVYIWLKEMKAYRQIISYNEDLCIFLKRRQVVKTNVLNAWISNFVKSGNLSRSCPITKNLYYVVNLQPDKEGIPPFSPAGQSRLQTNIYTRQNGFRESVVTGEFDMELK